MSSRPSASSPQALSILKSVASLSLILTAERAATPTRRCGNSFGIGAVAQHSHDVTAPTGSAVRDLRANFLTGTFVESCADTADAQSALEAVTARKIRDLFITVCLMVGEKTQLPKA